MVNSEEELKKLRAIMPYWIKHNKEHIEENKEWLARAEQAGLKEVAEVLRKVIQLSEETNKYIAAALEKLGGVAESADNSGHV